MEDIAAYAARTGRQTPFSHGIEHNARSNAGSPYHAFGGETRPSADQNVLGAEVAGTSTRLVLAVSRDEGRRRSARSRGAVQPRCCR
jgi:hypothetical protein